MPLIQPTQAHVDDINAKESALSDLRCLTLYGPCPRCRGAMMGQASLTTTPPGMHLDVVCRNCGAHPQ